MRTPCTFVAILTFAACVSSPAGESLASLGKADGVGVEPVLAFVNDPATTLALLETLIDNRGARNIIEHRAGPDGVYPGGGDDNPFDSVEELTALGYVKAHALSALTDYAQAHGYEIPACDTCLDVQTWDVVFNNPQCQTYRYDPPQKNRAGDLLIEQKPQHAYCTQADLATSAPQSPQARLGQWIDSLGAGESIFLAYLSYSDDPDANAPNDGGTHDALVAAAERGVEITLVLDAENGLSQKLQTTCARATSATCMAPTVLYRHWGSRYAHVKLTLPNPGNDGAYARMSFSSGNLSTGGTRLNHENWHFLQVATQSYFYQNHLCLRDALLDDEAYTHANLFRKKLLACRDAIAAAPESDVRAHFIPMREDRDVLASWVEGQVIGDASLGIAPAHAFDIAAHRFSLPSFKRALAQRLRDANDDLRVRLVVDDDLYWLEQGEYGGYNSYGDLAAVRTLYNAGVAVDRNDPRFESRYLETDYAGVYLNHNKFILPRNDRGGATTVLFGAANLTGTGFEKNLENIYTTTRPEVVRAFDEQFRRFWGERRDNAGNLLTPVATPFNHMPAELVRLTAP